MRTLKSLLGICEHRWIKVKEIAVYSEFGGVIFNNDVPAYHKWVLQCEKCGKINSKRI